MFETGAVDRGSRQGQFRLLSVNDSPRSGGIIWIFFIFLYWKVCCVFSLELLHQGDSNEYTQHTIINIKKDQHNNANQNARADKHINDAQLLQMLYAAFFQEARCCPIFYSILSHNLGRPSGHHR